MLLRAILIYAPFAILGVVATAEVIRALFHRAHQAVIAMPRLAFYSNMPARRARPRPIPRQISASSGVRAQHAGGRVLATRAHV